MAQDIEERTFKFALRVVELTKNIPDTAASRIVVKQLLRSATSIGANIEESHAGYSRDEFSYKVNISLKEARETHYRLRLLKEADMTQSKQLDDLLDEANQIKKILGSIVSKTRNKSK